MKKPYIDCPVCNKVNELPRKPKPDDLIVCCYCATMLEFDENTRITLLTSNKFLSFDADTQHGLNELVYTVVNKHK